MSNSNELRLIHWNADGVDKKQSELLHLLINLSVDVLAISETRLSSRSILNLPGYICYRNDKHSNGKGQGTAILIKDDIDHLLIPTPNTHHLEAIGIKLNTSNCKYTLFSVYQSPNLQLVTSDIDMLLETDHHVLLMGDFNAKHDHWYPGLRNTSGNILFNHLLNRDYTIYAPPSPTLVHYRECLTKSLPDLILANNIYNIENVKTVPALTSNHLPVFFTITIKVDRIIQQRHNYCKADWALYRSILNNNIHLSSQILKDTSEIDIAIDTLSENIILARDSAVPLITLSNTPKPLPRKIKRLIKFKNKLRRYDQLENDPIARKSIRTQVNYLNKNIKTGIKEHNDKIWNDKLRRVDNPSSDLWRLAKSMKLKSTTSSVQPLQRIDGTTAIAPVDQCETLADAFQKNMELTSQCYNQSMDKEVETSISALNELETGNSFKPVYPKEIWKQILKLKVHKAPGNDDIANCLIKNLPQKAIIVLTKIFNACLSLAYFPSAWKVAKVIALKKPGKDGSIPTSYRPISLLPSLAKLLEKIINVRLLKSTCSKLIDEQFGFRIAHSTTHQLARLAEHVSNSLNQGESSGMFLLDMEKAFDTVWHKGLIHKLMAINVPLSLIKIIKSYISQRSFKVHIGKISSTSYSVPAGVPQGSILGPHLFLIYINDIPRQTRTNLACFADDTACFTTSNDIDLIIDRLQLSIDKLIDYFRNWKLQINATKTEAIIFTRKRETPKRSLHVNKHPIPWSNSVKYLGVILDKKLNWNDHVCNLRLKGIKAFNALKPLLNRRSNLKSYTKLCIYSTLIRPCITYACPVWGCTSKSNLNKLQVLQNKAIKIAYNTPFRTNLMKLHTKIKFPSIKEFITKTTKKFYINADHNDNKLIAKLGKTRPQLSNRYKYVTKLPHHYAL